jgi:hypothetical protein
LWWWRQRPCRSDGGGTLTVGRWARGIGFAFFYSFFTTLCQEPSLLTAQVSRGAGSWLSANNCLSTNLCRGFPFGKVRIPVVVVSIRLHEMHPAHFHYILTIKKYCSHYIATYNFVLEILHHHKKVNITMYYSTILIYIRSDFTLFPTSKKIHTCNHIGAISVPLHI